MMGSVTHIGTKTGQNEQITPIQLLELARADIESGELNPVRMLIYIVEEKDTDDVISTYRSNLPVDKEQCLLANQLFKLQWKRVS